MAVCKDDARCRRIVPEAARQRAEALDQAVNAIVSRQKGIQTVDKPLGCGQSG